MLLTCLALFFGFCALHLPFRSQFLVNWDSVQFALGTLSFNLEHHQPHPPGYIGYVGLGALLNHFTGDPNTSLTLISAISGGAAPAALFILGRRFLSDRYALLVSVLFGTSPLIWYYSRVALTYAVEVAVALPFAWACHRARVDRSARHLWVASLLLAGLGALRPSAFVLLLPLWLFTIWAWPVPWRLRATGLLAAGTLVWLLPLLWLAGGPSAYVRTGYALASLVGGETSILAGNLLGLARNLLVVLGVVVGLHMGLGLIALAHHRGRGTLDPLLPRDRKFFVVWAAPALLTYLFGHTGQLGYTLLLLPIGFLWLGRSLQELFGSSTLGRRALPGARQLRLGLGAVAATFLVGNLLAVALLPNTASALLQQAISLTEPKPSDSVQSTLLAGHIRQFDLGESDAYWRSLFGFIRRYNQQRTAVLAVPAGSGNGSFRHLGYYLPEYRVYALGWDRRGAFGHLFSTYQGESNYRVEGLRTSRCLLPLPHAVTRLIIPDGEITEFLDSRLPQSVIPLDADNSVLVVEIPPGSALAVLPGKGSSRLITVMAQDSLPPETNWAGSDFCVP